MKIPNSINTYLCSIESELQEKLLYSKNSYISLQQLYEENTSVSYSNGVFYFTLLEKKYSIVISKYAFRMSITINTDNLIYSDLSGNLSQTPTYSDRLLFSIGENGINFFDDDYSWKNLPFITSEEDYFMQNTIYDFGSFDLEGLQKINDFYMIFRNMYHKRMNK